MTRRIPAELHDWLAGFLDSLDKVELVSHLAAAGGPVPKAELRVLAQLDDSTFRSAIDSLESSRVIERVGPCSVRLGPNATTPECEALMRLYVDDPVAVIAALVSISVDRIRSMAARTFADAFVLRRKK